MSSEQLNGKDWKEKGWPIIEKWWLRMADLEREGDDGTHRYVPAETTAKGRFKGNRAELRRANSLNEIFACRAFQELRRDWEQAPLPYTDQSDSEQDRLAAVAWVLAEVRYGDPRKLGTQFGQSEVPGTEAPRVKEVRIKQLIDCRNREELCRMLRRILGIVEHRANPQALFEMVYLWGDVQRRKLANEYYIALLSNTESPSQP